MRVQGNLSGKRLVNKIERVEFPSTLRSPQGRLVLSHMRQDDRQDTVRHTICRIELDGIAQGCLCGNPVPIKPKLEQAQRGLRLAKIG